MDECKILKKRKIIGFHETGKSSLAKNNSTPTNSIPALAMRTSSFISNNNRSYTNVQSYQIPSTSGINITRKIDAVVELSMMP